MSHSIKNPGLLVAAKKRIIDVSRWLGGYHGTHAVIVVASLLIIAIIWVALAVQLRNERQDIVNGVIKDNANLARAFEEHAIRTFKGVDAVALFLKHEYARSGSALDIGRYINNGTIDSRLFTVVSILDEQGTVVASAGVPLNLNFADREYFKVHLQQDSGKAYISKPTVGRVSGKWAFQLTRRINKPDGRFGGIVSVGINPVYFANFYQQSDLGESGLAMLVGLDGISRVRQAGRVSTFGQDLSNNTLLTYRRNKPVGNFLSAGKVEGVPRYVSYRTLAEYPLMVAVGTSEKEMLAEFSQRKRKYYTYALLFSGGTVVFAAMLMMALMRLRRSANVLAERAVQFRATFENAAVGIVHTDFNHRYLRVNAKFCDMLGYTRDELLQMSTRDTNHPDELDQHGLGNQKLLAGEVEEHTSERRYLHKNGTSIWAKRTVSLVRDGDGNPLYFIRVIEDVTARKRAEQGLVRERSLLRTVVDAIPERIYVKDREGRFLLQNATNMKERSISSHDEIMGKTVFDLFPRAQAERMHAEDAAVMDSGVPLISREHQTNFTTSETGGTVHWHLTTKLPLRDNAGHVIGLVGVNQDITDRKLAEERMRGLNEELEEKVQARTVDLERARLEAEDANSAKSLFLATMSHEIRTPMNGVIGMIDVLHQSGLKGDQVEMVDLIRESAFSLLGIINDILDFSKIEAGKLEIEHESLSVTDVVESVGSLMNGMAEKKSVLLKMFIDPAIPAQVIGDTLRLRQVLTNLVNNAVKFSSGKSRSGNVSIRARLVDRSPDQVTVIFQVTDNGIGMDEQTLLRLFAAFTQADASTTRRYGGTGLGLAIANHLVELMGGEITVQSEPGMGSTFKVRVAFGLASATAVAADPSFNVAGINCVVIGSAGGLADDLAQYLDYASAQVERVPDVETARQRMVGRSGAVVWVVDAGDEPRAPGALRAAVSGGVGEDMQMVCVLIERGRRRRPRVVAPDLITVDGNALGRRLFLRIVAAAAGRVSLETDADTLAAGRVGAIAPTRDEALRRGRLILVAEDNETNQKVILRQLALLGNTADIASDGLEALKCWRKGHYALLLTDVHMPSMDGYELTEAIRSEEGSGAAIPIVALTANVLKGEAERCRAIGMNDYCSKPMSLANLKSMLDKWLPEAESDAVVPAKSAVLAAPVPPPSAVARTAASGLVDINVLEELVGSDQAMLRDFLQDFRTSAAKITSELRVACAANQAKVAAAAAHKLKSSSRAVGAMALGDLCAAIEEAGNGNEHDALSVLLPRFEMEMAAVDTYVDKFYTAGGKFQHITGNANRD